MLYLVILSLFGYCTIIVATRYANASKSPIFVISFIAIMEYFASFVGILLPMTYIIFGGGLMSLLASLYLRRKSSLVDFAKDLFQPGLVIFFLSILVIYPFSKPVFVSSYDEFSHWALYTKYLITYDRIPTNTSVVPFFFLPPIGSLVQYYFARLLGGSEGMFFWAKNIFMFAAISSALSNIKWNQPVKIVLAYILPFLILLKYNEFQFFNLYTDALTAFVAFSAFACYLYSDRDYKDILKIIPILFIVPLIRESAPTFALFTGILILFDQIALKGLYLKTDGIKHWVKKNRHVLISLLLFLVVIISTISWNLFVIEYQNDAIFHMSTRGNPRSLKETAIYITDFFENINEAMVGYQARDYRIFSNMPMIYLFAVSIILIILLLLHYKKMDREHRCLKAYGLSMTITTIIYILGLLYVYLFRFGEEEANVFAAMSRYLSTIAMYIMLCTTVYIMKVEQDSQDSLVKKSIKYALILTMLLMLFSTNPQRVNIFKGRVLGYVDIRQVVHEKTVDISDLVDEDDKVYVVYQGYTNPIVIHATQYELMTYINPRNWILGVDGYDVSSQEFKQLLIDEGYDYVFIGQGDESFWRTYGDLFDVNDGTYRFFALDNTEEYILKGIK